MSNEYLRQNTPAESHESALQPRNLYLVVNVASHYFGQIVEEIDTAYINEHNCIALWIKDSITGLWFRNSELEKTTEDGLDLHPFDLDEDDEYTDS